MRLCMSDCSFAQLAFEYLASVTALFSCCMAGALETAAISAHVLCTPLNHHFIRRVVRVFRCDLLPALLAE